MVEVSFDGGSDEGEDVLGLLAAGFHDGQQGFHEAAARGALGAEREFSPDHRMPQGALASVVGGLDAFYVHEGPQPLAMIREFLRHADAGERSAQQHGVDLISDRFHAALESDTCERAVTIAGPEAK